MAHYSEPLPLTFYERDSVLVARELIGSYLVRTLPAQSPADAPLRLAGRIVETEAYRQDDPASHSYRGRTPRAEIMYGPAGRAYVYFIYGMYHCLNAVTEREGVGAAVLIRAVEPIEDAATMWQHRFPDKPYEGTERQHRSIASGPGKLTLAFGIRREYDNGESLIDGSITICPGMAFEVPSRAPRVAATPRVGISTAQDKLWRFVDAESGYLSKPLPRSTALSE